jgi:hypothetical protein
MEQKIVCTKTSPIKKGSICKRQLTGDDLLWYGKVETKHYKPKTGS